MPALVSSIAAHPPHAPEPTIMASYVGMIRGVHCHDISTMITKTTKITRIKQIKIEKRLGVLREHRELRGHRDAIVVRVDHRCPSHNPMLRVSARRKRNVVRVAFVVERFDAAGT